MWEGEYRQGDEDKRHRYMFLLALLEFYRAKESQPACMFNEKKLTQLLSCFYLSTPTHVDRPLHTPTHPNIHTGTHPSFYTHIQTDRYTHRHTSLLLQTHTQIDKYTHRPTHMYKCTHRHTHAYVHTKDYLWIVVSRL